MHKIIRENIHYLDYRTHITLEVGEKRLNSLKRILDSCVPESDYYPILMDARDITFDSEETHLIMSKKSRETFLNGDNGYRVKLAILNNSYTGELNTNEAWFQEFDSALEWLKI